MSINGIEATVKGRCGIPERAELKARLVEAYGDSEHAEHLAEAELRHREAPCSHIFCGRPAYEDGGCLAHGIPLCSEHAHLVPGLFDCDAAVYRFRDEIVEWLRECEARAIHKDTAAAFHNAADGIEQRWGVA